jgi:hypothetical protein
VPSSPHAALQQSYDPGAQGCVKPTNTSVRGSGTSSVSRCCVTFRSIGQSLNRFFLLFCVSSNHKSCDVTIATCFAKHLAGSVLHEFRNRVCHAKRQIWVQAEAQSAGTVPEKRGSKVSRWVRVFSLPCRTPLRQLGCRTFVPNTAAFGLSHDSRGLLLIVGQFASPCEEQDYPNAFACVATISPAELLEGRVPRIAIRTFANHVQVLTRLNQTYFAAI